MATYGSSAFAKPHSGAYPDSQYNASVSNIQPTLGSVFDSIERLVRQPGNEAVAFGSNETMPYTNRTLFDARKFVVDLTQTVSALNLESKTGWQFVFAAPERTKSTTITQKIKLAPQYVLDREPEGVPPRYVTLYEDSVSTTLERFGLGTSMFNDIAKEADGQQEAADKLAILVSAGNRTGKIMVENAVINAKLLWKELQRQNGPIFSGVKAAMQETIDMFGIFNKDQRGLYILNAKIEDTIKSTNKDITMNNLVVCPRTLSYISIGNRFETDASVREAREASETLLLGARRFAGLMPGKYVFENKEWNIDGNMPAEEYQAWRRTAAIGQYTMISPSDDDKGQRSDELTVLINNFKADIMMPWTVKQAIRQAQRFGDDGQLHEELYKFAANLKTQLVNSGITTLKDGNIDPYITINHSSSAGTGEDVDVRSLDPESIHVIRHWGAMKSCYFPYELSAEFGRRAAKVIAESQELEQKDFNNLRNYGKLVERLSTVPLTANAATKEAILKFITDVAAANPIVDAPTRVLPGNAYGSLNLPAGFKAAAGTLPYGYAGINHFRYLASLVNDEDLAAWSSLLEEIAEVVKSVDAYYGVLKKIVPDSALFNAEYVPAFARSGVREYDEISAFVYNSPLGRYRYPVWYRVGGGVAPGGAANPSKAAVAANLVPIIRDVLVDLRADPVVGGDKAPNFLQQVANRLRDTVRDWLLKVPVVKDVPVSATAVAENAGGELQTLFQTKVAPQIAVQNIDPNNVYLRELFEKHGGTTEEQRINFAVNLLSMLFNVANGARISNKLTDKQFSQWRTAPAQSTPTNKRSLAQVQETDRPALDSDFVSTRLIFAPVIFKVFGDNDALRPEDAERGDVLAAQGANTGQDFFAYAHANARTATSASLNFLYASKASANGGPSKKAKRTRLRGDFDDVEDFDVRGGVRPSGFDDDERNFVRQSLINDPTGPFTNAGGRGGDRRIVERYLVERVVFIEQACSTFEAIPAVAAALSIPTERSLLTFVNHGLPLPDSCYIRANPWIRFTTEGMLAFSTTNGPVGSFLYAFDDISNQYDNSSKSWQVHYTIYLGVMIKQLDHMMFIQDVTIVEYLGGCDDTVFSIEDGFDPRNIDFSAGSNLKSAFVMSCGANFTRSKARECANPLSLTGDYEHSFLRRSNYDVNSGLGSRKKLQYPSALYYDYLFGFSMINQRRNYSDVTFRQVRDSSYLDSVTCLFMAPHNTYNRATNNFSNLIPGDGHLAEVRAPCRAYLSNAISVLSDRIHQQQQYIR